MRRPIAWMALVLLLPPFFCSGCRGCTSLEPQSERRGLLYHSIPVAIRFSPPDEALADRVWAFLEGVDGTFNNFRSDTEIGRLNLSTLRQGVPISPDLAEVLGLALELGRLTGGAFDPAAGASIRMWREAASNGVLPDEDRIAAARAATGMDHVRLEGSRVWIDDPNVTLDLGGVVKGWAVDRAVEMLQKAGARSASIQVGGEVAVFGRPGAAIGVRHPGDPEALFTTLYVREGGLACSTSGNYERPVRIDGQEYYHIVDPRTGRPALLTRLSITVAFAGVGKNGLADGLATAGTLLPLDEFLRLVAAQGGEALVLVRGDSGIEAHATPGFERLRRASHE